MVFAPIKDFRVNIAKCAESRGGTGGAVRSRPRPRFQPVRADHTFYPI